MMLTENHDESLFAADGVVARMTDELLFSDIGQLKARANSVLDDWNEIQQSRALDAGVPQLAAWIQAGTWVGKAGLALIPESTGEAALYISGGKIGKELLFRGVPAILKEGRMLFNLSTIKNTVERVKQYGLGVSSPTLRVSDNLLSQYKNSLQPRIKTPCPAEIYYEFSSLSKRQIAVLEKLPKVRSTTLIKKSDFNVTDLSALTAKTGDEFAMFTLGSRRLIIRGDEANIYIEALIPKLKQEGWTWSAHTHPGITHSSLIPSGKGGDRAVLEFLNQEQSLILNSTGKRSLFGVGEGMQENLSVNSIKARSSTP